MARDAQQREVYERRIWRLAYLLTGNAPGAARLADRVLRDQPRIERLEPARLDRTVIQHARDLPRTTSEAIPDLPAPQGEAAEALRAVLSLPEQPREAWVLARVDELEDLHVSRAMDCSKTASRNHLNAADAQMASRFAGDALRPARALRAFADSLDPGRIIRAHRQERRTRAVRRAAVVASVALVALLVLALLLLRM